MTYQDRTIPTVSLDNRPLALRAVPRLGVDWEVETLETRDPRDTRETPLGTWLWQLWQLWARVSRSQQQRVTSSIAETF